MTNEPRNLVIGGGANISVLQNPVLKSREFPTHVIFNISVDHTANRSCSESHPFSLHSTILLARFFVHFTLSVHFYFSRIGVTLRLNHRTVYLEIYLDALRTHHGILKVHILIFVKTIYRVDKRCSPCHPSSFLNLKRNGTESSRMGDLRTNIMTTNL